jgi:hypothetical protein
MVRVHSVDIEVGIHKENVIAMPSRGGKYELKHKYRPLIGPTLAAPVILP